MSNATTSYVVFFFFFNDTATTEIYTLSLHDALPISLGRVVWSPPVPARLDAIDWKILDELQRNGRITNVEDLPVDGIETSRQDRKSTRLNSSHLVISYAVFCLKKKNSIERNRHITVY